MRKTVVKSLGARTVAAAFLWCLYLVKISGVNAFCFLNLEWHRHTVLISFHLGIVHGSLLLLVLGRWLLATVGDVIIENNHYLRMMSLAILNYVVVVEKFVSSVKRSLIFCLSYHVYFSPLYQRQKTMDWVEKWTKIKFTAQSFLVESFININWCLLFSLKSNQGMFAKKKGSCSIFLLIWMEC